MLKYLPLILMLPLYTSAQLKWKNADSLYQPLPPGIHVYFSNDSIDGKPNRAYYVTADLQDRSLEFITDTSANRRLTPSSFFERNQQPLVVVNCSFFEFVHNSNLNIVMNKGRLLAYNTAVPGRGRDTLTYKHPLVGAIGISKKRKADVAWTFTDSSEKRAYAIQQVQLPIVDSNKVLRLKNANYTNGKSEWQKSALKKWKMQTAVGGGPVLLQNGSIAITNNEELKFAGKGIQDKHPRTGMGYTAEGKLVILVVQGRTPGIAEGVTLVQEAQLLRDIGCTEALNLDGGGSSCLLVNGKETIRPSDKAGQRPVPAVFMIKSSE